MSLKIIPFPLSLKGIRSYRDTCDAVCRSLNTWFAQWPIRGSRVSNKGYGPLRPILLGVLLAGCTPHVAPWERGNLAKPQMSLEPVPLNAALMRHTYGSKEAATGGYGVGGGGCGCN
jgi:hypothetical protein